MKRRIIKRKDLIYFDRGYCSYLNYIMGINEFGIVPLIFPQSFFKEEKLRSKMAYPLDVLIPALKDYLKKTNRRITFEYILLSGINDSSENALELAKLVKGINCYINLIPYNETNNLNFKRTSTVQIMKFYDILKKNNVNVTIRREFGSKISAACGQLRSKKEEL